jgi:hypothetical protein
MIWGAERPEPTLCGPFAFPLVVAGEIDVLPAEWGEILQQLAISGVTVPYAHYPIHASSQRLR